MQRAKFGNVSFQEKTLFTFAGSQQVWLTWDHFNPFSVRLNRIVSRWAILLRACVCWRVLSQAGASPSAPPLDPQLHCWGRQPALTALGLLRNSQRPALWSGFSSLLPPALLGHVPYFLENSSTHHLVCCNLPNIQLRRRLRHLLCLS